jgi:hypothetical protein
MSAPASYSYKPHERPFMPGSPANPDHPAGRKVMYVLIGLLLGITSGFQNGLLLANLAQIQGALGLSVAEGGWLTASFSMTSACMSLLLYKVRQQFGMDSFLRLGVTALVLVNFVQLFHTSYLIEIFARGMSGLVNSVMSTLCIFYLMQGLPAHARIAGLLLGLGLVQVAIPLARAISPVLMSDGDVQHLFILQFSLSLMVWGATAWLHLPEGDKIQAFEPLDIVSFALLAGGIALLTAFMAQGRIVNWSADWLGYALAGAIVMVGTSLWIEHERANPMLMIRWMTSSDILKFAITGALVRVLLSEQTVGATGLLATVGMSNAQMVSYNVVLMVASLAGLLLSIALLDPTDLRRPVLVSLALIAIASFIDVGASNLTRPGNLYFTQSVVAFAAVYFMGPMLMEGLLRALARGPAYILSFSAVFGLSQTLGGLAGASFLTWFQTWRTKAHLVELGTHLQLSDPLIAQRAQLLGNAMVATVSDPAQRAARGVAMLVQQVTREANILAFNDVFLLLGTLALLLLLLLGAVWLRDRWRGHIPLSKELAALQAMQQRKTT